MPNMPAWPSDRGMAAHFLRAIDRAVIHYQNDIKKSRQMR